MSATEQRGAVKSSARPGSANAPVANAHGGVKVPGGDNPGSDPSYVAVNSGGKDTSGLHLDAVKNARESANAIFQLRPHASITPFIMGQGGAQRATYGKNYALGTITRYEHIGSSFDSANSTAADSTFGDQVPNFGFRMHYNPASLSVNAPWNQNLVNNPNDTALLFGMGGLGSVSFDLMINRTEDVMNNTRLDRPVHGAREMAKLGSQYDIEWLHMVIGGLPRIPNHTADRGYILSRLILLNLGGPASPLKFVGWISNISVQHIKFNVNMVPLVSMVSITVQRCAEDGPPGSSTVDTPVTPPPAPAIPTQPTSGTVPGQPHVSVGWPR